MGIPGSEEKATATKMATPGQKMAPSCCDAKDKEACCPEPEKADCCRPSRPAGSCGCR